MKRPLNVLTLLLGVVLFLGGIVALDSGNVAEVAAGGMGMLAGMLFISFTMAYW